MSAGETHNEEDWMDVRAIAAFCCDEVERQGHSLQAMDGMERVVWMMDAWRWAWERHKYTDVPNCATVARLGQIVEPQKNEYRFRSCGVRVGDHVAPPPEAVLGLMQNWEQALLAGKYAPDEAYVEFERIHPFRDGNGRVGKIIHNWLNGTLARPVLVKDYFGCGNP